MICISMLFLGLVLSTKLSFAQEPLEFKPEEISQAAEIDTGDTAWMMTSTVLVLDDDNSGSLSFLCGSSSCKKCPFHDNA